jgi:hypothetical protein
MARQITPFQLIPLALLLFGVTATLHYYEIDYLRWPNHLAMVSALIVAAASLLRSIHSLRGRLIFGVSIPVRADLRR